MSDALLQPETGELSAEGDALSNAVIRGLAQADLAEIGITAINLQDGVFTEEQLVKMGEANRRIAAVPPSESVIEISNAKSFGEGFRAWARNPVGITGELFAQSLVSLAKRGLKKIGAGAAVGAAAGNIPGAVIGAVAGLGVANYQLEAGLTYVSSLTEALEEHGLDPNNPEDWQIMFNDSEILKAAKDKAVARGLSTTLVGTAFSALAGVVAGTGANVARTLAGAGIEFVGEGVGEATAQIVSGEGINSW